MLLEKHKVRFDAVKKVCVKIINSCIMAISTVKISHKSQADYSIYKRRAAAGSRNGTGLEKERVGFPVNCIYSLFGFFLARN